MNKEPNVSVVRDDKKAEEKQQEKQAPRHSVSTDTPDDRKILTKEDIFSTDLQEGTVRVDKWGGSVRIRELTKEQQGWCRDHARSATPGVDFDDDAFADMVFQRGVISPVFTAQDIALLRSKSAEAFDLVVMAIMNISGLSQDSVNRARRQFQAE